MRQRPNISKSHIWGSKLLKSLLIHKKSKMPRQLIQNVKIQHSLSFLQSITRLRTYTNESLKDLRHWSQREVLTCPKWTVTIVTLLSVAVDDTVRELQVQICACIASPNENFASVFTFADEKLEAYFFCGKINFAVHYTAEKTGGSFAAAKSTLQPQKCLPFLQWPTFPAVKEQTEP